MRILKAITICVAAVIGLLAQSAFAAQITPFSITQSGFTVSFSSTPNPNAFVVNDSIPFVTLQGGTLIELFDNNNTLTMTFSQPVDALAFNFALSIPVPGNLDFQAFSGATLVDSGSWLATSPPGNFFVEGLALEFHPTFDTLVLSSIDAEGFALDNLVIEAASGQIYFFPFDVPEPVTLTLFAAGLFGVGALRRRRKASATL